MLDTPVPMASGGRFQYQVPEAPVFFNPFSDQTLTWDWPMVTSSQHSNLNPYHTTTSAMFNVAAAAVASAGLSLMNGVDNDSLDQSLDFMDLYQTPSQNVLAPNELQYCFDHHSQGQASSLGLGITFEYPTLPLSLDSCSNNMGLGLNVLSLDMPGLCPLQLDI